MVKILESSTKEDLEKQLDEAIRDGWHRGNVAVNNGIYCATIEKSDIECLNEDR